MDTDVTQLKPRLLEYLQSSGAEVDQKKKPPVTQCPSPGHADAHPSAVIYEEHVFCPVCKDSWDVFDVAGFIEGTDEFAKQLDAVRSALGERAPEKNKKQTDNGGKKKNVISLSIDKARGVYTKEEIQRIADRMHWGKFVKAWSYKNKRGEVSFIDVRFENDAGKKSVISFWYNGKTLRSTGCPIGLYNLDRALSEGKPLLIVEGAKSAEAAEVLKDFVPVTWNGGSSKVKKVQWNLISSCKEIYIFPDDDHKKDMKGKKWPWHKQPGMHAALDIQKFLPQAKIVRPLNEARKIKADGADIVEALQVKKPDELAKYIKESNPVKPPEPETKKKADPPSEFPFRVLGTADDNRAYFIGLSGRLHDVPLAKVTKGDLYVMAGIDYWRRHFGHKGKVDWEDSISTITEIASQIDFDPGSLRGRGAWREKDGSICYHDGEVTYGDKSEKHLYLRKTRRDIGICDEPATVDWCRETSDTVSQMSFETSVDAIRIMAWTAISPFAGALPWRPCGMITGSSGTGKTTVIDYFVRPVALPEIFSGGDSSEAGVRQKVRNDSCAIVIEEAETDTQKKRWRRADLFSLMRQSTSDDAPRVAKGTVDGKGMSFTMKNMFLFAAISPEVEHIADDNRIFRVNMVRPSGDWAPLRDSLKRLVTEDRCRAFRSLAWKKLQTIADLRERMVSLVQDVTGKGTRYALAESTLFATYLVLWRRREDLTDKEICSRLIDWYSLAPPDESYDETVDFLDQILGARVSVELGKREELTLREILIGSYAFKLPDSSEDEIITAKDADYLRRIAGRHGLKIKSDGNLAIVSNCKEITKITGRGRGYQRILYRHRGLVSKSKNEHVTALGQKRCVILSGVLDEKTEEKKQ
jgi:hypothetical protein